MANRIRKYNPAFLPPEELVRRFVVRHAELELIVQVVGENRGQSNQHVLVIGPRGIGKTMLVLPVVEEVRGNEDLAARWYPLVFSEESYLVRTPGEFWLEALFHLAHKTDDERWRRTYEELRDEQDEERLRERALAQLMDFADREGKRILLVVENFNMLLGEQMSEGDAWKLRHTLQHEARVMLLATATPYFRWEKRGALGPEMKNWGRAMFELFKLHELKPLDEEECGKLWNSVSGKEASDERVRPLQILTGGNPRLLAIISSFAGKMSLKELMDDLMELVDDNTEYFKSHLDSLPAVERRVYLALAELWDPVPAGKVAEVARLGVSKTSSLLKRLMERGVVVQANGERRRKLYEVCERMYNIYYLMRRCGGPSRRVKALVRFMVPFYGEEELVSLTQRIAEEACKLTPELRGEHLLAYKALVESAVDVSVREKLIKVTPPQFFEMLDIPSSIKALIGKETAEGEKASCAEVAKVIEEAYEVLDKRGDREEAEGICRRLIEVAPGDGWAWAARGVVMTVVLGRDEEAEEAFRKAIELKPESGLPH
ncbi:MAG: AAA family ATPase [Planctomycetota bacterium]|jgi:tetratricopeptide (TPR) repeat protein